MTLADLTRAVAPAARDGLAAARKRLADLPVSPWAKDVQVDINGRVWHADGDPYDPDDPQPERHRMPAGGPKVPPDFNGPPPPGKGK